MTQHLPSRLWRSPSTLLCAVFALAAGNAFAESTDVVWIEEHWELKVGEPDADRSAPQVTMVMSPTDNLDGHHFLFTLNHLGIPSYEAGGVQMQAWDGDELLGYDNDDEEGALINNEETLTWVQRMRLDGGMLKFRILNGQSTTWNQFGNEDMALNVPSSLTRLNTYKPAVSLSESQVNYAENRVVSLTLTKLKWQTKDGTVHEQSAPIPIDTSLDP
jgi:hypothetical protein